MDMTVDFEESFRSGADDYISLVSLFFDSPDLEPFALSQARVANPLSASVMEFTNTWVG